MALNISCQITPIFIAHYAFDVSLFHSVEASVCFSPSWLESDVCGPVHLYSLNPPNEPQITPRGRLGFICHIVFCPLSFFRIYLCSTHKHKSCADRRICLCIDCHTRDAPKSIAFTWPLFLPSSPPRRETLRVVIFRNLTARYEQGGVLFAVFEGKFRPKS